MKPSQGSSAKDFGIVSTPMIHYFVVCKNTDGAYGECSEKGYNEKLSKAFKTIRGQVRCKGHQILDSHSLFKVV